MSKITDTIRCPYCGGDMLTTTNIHTNAQDRECCLCGVEQEIRFNPKTHSRYIMRQFRPRALIYLEQADGSYSYIQINHSRKVYHLVKAWKKRIYAAPGVYNVAKCYGTIWNPKRKKLKIVFGKELPRHDDAYYADEGPW